MASLNHNKFNLSSPSGADVNRQTSTNDHTVLSLACAGGHIPVVELLLTHGADPTHKLKVSQRDHTVLMIKHVDALHCPFGDK